MVAGPHCQGVAVAGLIGSVESRSPPVVPRCRRAGSAGAGRHDQASAQSGAGREVRFAIFTNIERSTLDITMPGGRKRRERVNVIVLSAPSATQGV